MKKRCISRRTFVNNSAVGMMGFGILGKVHSAFKLGTLLPRNMNLFEKYGPLIKDPLGVINLPDRFNYKIISRTGQKMTDGLITPDKPDGMATFSGSNGRVILIRNHELMPGQKGAFGKQNQLLSRIPIDKIYDKGKHITPGPGGTTTLIYNEKKRRVEKSWLSLAGTLRNCAGGPTPWNSWISCEEIFMNKIYHHEKDHGFAFEVPATEKMGLTDPVPIKAMGKFNHEAICVDPETGIVYLSEDREDGLLYRFIPRISGKLLEGGILQALMLKGKPTFDTRNWPEKKEILRLNHRYSVDWITLENICPQIDDLRKRGAAAGAAIFARGEGMAFHDHCFYFACTSGGMNQRGQIFRYFPNGDEGGDLELYLEPNDVRVLNNPDNITVAPWGDLIICEDNSHPFIVGFTPNRNMYKLAENAGSESEFTGGVFSPSGKTFFVNIQHDGITLAIQGPWTQVG